MDSWQGFVKQMISHEYRLAYLFSVCPCCRYPNLKSVKELIYKRGFGKLNKARAPLTDNSIIEEVRGFEFHSTHPCVSVLNANSAVLKFEMCLWCHIFPAFETLKGFIFAGSWQVRHHLHWGSYPWDLHCGSSFQGGQQLFAAIQAKLKKKKQPLYWVWRCWK
jgi:hypothetical protein